MKAYIAYGSNMDEAQMAERCPEAVLWGTGVLKGWRLMYKGSKTGAYATIERARGGRVPVVVWKITAGDEAALDGYEGFPKFYYKKDIWVHDFSFDGIEAKRKNPVKGMAYIMHEKRKFGMPSGWYQKMLEDAYWYYDFDPKILEASLQYTQEMIKGKRR